MKLKQQVFVYECASGYGYDGDLHNSYQHVRVLVVIVCLVVKLAVTWMEALRQAHAQAKEETQQVVVVAAVVAVVVIVSSELA